MQWAVGVLGGSVSVKRPTLMQNIEGYWLKTTEVAKLVHKTLPHPTRENESIGTVCYDFLDQLHSLLSNDELFGDLNNHHFVLFAVQHCAARSRLFGGR